MLNTVVKTLVNQNAWRATKFVSPSRVIRVTRRRYRTGFYTRDLNAVIHDGKPNYAERLFIKKLRRAGEPFPVRKIQLKMAPKTRVV